jgi:protoheme IX farnesyltransferase
MSSSAAMSTFQSYLELTKPRVIALILLTAIVGMLLAAPWIPWQPLFYGTIGIGFTASSAAVINQIIDRHIDAKMGRTQNRPLPSGKMSPLKAIIFATLLGVIGMATLFIFVNSLTAWLTFATLIGYALIYTVFLKRATPQNIVIGGLAGATPPLLGWTAVTGNFDYASLLLVLIIFTWTPPHFWALAVARYEEYKKAEIPMLPVTHGIPFTLLCTLLYTFLMIACSLLPYAVGMSGLFYLGTSSLLNAGFLYWVVRLYRTHDRVIAMKTFYYSIFYLMLMFIVLLIDHYI